MISRSYPKKTPELEAWKRIADKRSNTLVVKRSDAARHSVLTIITVFSLLTLSR